MFITRPRNHVGRSPTYRLSCNSRSIGMMGYSSPRGIGRSGQTYGAVVKDMEMVTKVGRAPPDDWINTSVSTAVSSAGLLSSMR